MLLIFSYTSIKEFQGLGEPEKITSSSNSEILRWERGGGGAVVNKLPDWFWIQVRRTYPAQHDVAQYPGRALEPSKPQNIYLYK
jgi:hypothetical protein